MATTTGTTTTPAALPALGPYAQAVLAATAAPVALLPKNLAPLIVSVVAPAGAQVARYASVGDFEKALAADRAAGVTHAGDLAYKHTLYARVRLPGGTVTPDDQDTPDARGTYWMLGHTQAPSAAEVTNPIFFRPIAKGRLGPFRAPGFVWTAHTQDAPRVARALAERTTSDGAHAFAYPPYDVRQLAEPLREAQLAATKAAAAAAAGSGDARAAAGKGAAAAADGPDTFAEVARRQAVAARELAAYPRGRHPAWLAPEQVPPTMLAPLALAHLERLGAFPGDVEADVVGALTLLADRLALDGAAPRVTCGAGDAWPTWPLVTCLMAVLAPVPFAQQGWVRWAAARVPTLSSGTLDAALARWSNLRGVAESAGDAAAMRGELHASTTVMHVLAQGQSALFAHARGLVLAVSLAERVLRHGASVVPPEGAAAGWRCALTDVPLVAGERVHALDVRVRMPGAAAADDPAASQHVVLLVSAASRAAWPLLPPPPPAAAAPAAPGKRKRVRSETLGEVKSPQKRARTAAAAAAPAENDEDSAEADAAPTGMDVAASVVQSAPLPVPVPPPQPAGRPVLKHPHVVPPGTRPSELDTGVAGLVVRSTPAWWAAWDSAAREYHAYPDRMQLDARVYQHGLAVMHDKAALGAWLQQHGRDKLERLCDLASLCLGPPGPDKTAAGSVDNDDDDDDPFADLLAAAPPPRGALGITMPTDALRALVALAERARSMPATKRATPSLTLESLLFQGDAPLQALPAFLALFGLDY